MIKFDQQIRIYRPLQDVFAFVATPENDFHWQYGTLTSAQISAGEMGIGTLFRAVGHFMGRRMESVYEVMEFETNKQYGFRSRSGTLYSHTLYLFDLHKGTTRINVFAQLDSVNLLMVNASVVEKSLKKQYKENLTLLKDILESSPVVKRPDTLAAF